MAAEQAEAHRIAILEGLFRDEEKDITFQLADGQECAHKAILKAASEVFGQMFAYDMQEKATRVISLPDVSRKVMRVFLRLVYSGSMDESDWADGEASKEQQQGEPGRLVLAQASNQQQGNAGPLVLKQAHVTVEGSRLISTADSWAPSALLRGGGTGDFAFSVRSENWKRHHAMLGIAPADCRLCGSMHKAHGFYGHALSGTLSKLHAQDGTSGKALPSALQLPAGAEVTVKLEDGALSFAVNGGQFVVANFDTPIPMGVEYAPAVLFYSKHQAVDVVSRMSAPQVLCPLDILLGVTCLAKKYMVTVVLRMCTLVLKQRVWAAKSRRDVISFVRVMAAAIESDIGAVRMAALKVAEDFAELRSLYEEGTLRPEVSHDLEAIWPPPVSEECKRRKIAHLA